MKRTILALTVTVMALAICGWAQTNDEHSKVIKRLDDASADLNRLTSAPDNGIPNSMLAKAKCVAIVPSLVKGGFIFGAEHGRGVATCRVANGRWSGPAFFTVTGGSWGAQIGGEDVDLVMLFMTDEGAKKLLAANWKIGADVGIAAGPWGRQGTASTDWKMNTAILTYSKAKGAFIGATLNGTNVHVDEPAMQAFYSNSSADGFRKVLTGDVQPPLAARQFLSSIRHDFHEATASE
jgi:lipid-binding SYLF domain-containing protein